MRSKEQIWADYMTKGSPDDVAVEHLLSLVTTMAEDDDYKRLQWFLTAGGNPNVEDKNGNSLLARAVSCNKPAFVRLLGTGVKCVAIVSTRRTPCTSHCLSPVGATCDTLWLYGCRVGRGTVPLTGGVVAGGWRPGPRCDVSSVNRRGVPVLLHVRTDPDVDNIDCLKVLLHEFGVDINSKDAEGNTLLHNAACEGNELVVAYLVDNGASVTMTNSSGETPEQTAHRSEHAVVEEMLREMVRKAPPPRVSVPHHHTRDTRPLRMSRQCMCVSPRLSRLGCWLMTSSRLSYWRSALVLVGDGAYRSRNGRR